MTERLYIGSWIFNTRRTTNQFSPGAIDRNIDLAAWINDAIADGLVSTGGGGGGDTLYTADGTVQDRIVTVTGILSLIGDANQCELSANVNNSEAIVAGNDGKYILSLGQNGAFFTDTSGGLEGLRYTADYSATFGSNSLVNKAYVDQEIATVQPTVDATYAEDSYSMSSIIGGHKVIIASTSTQTTTITLGDPDVNNNKLVTVKFQTKTSTFNVNVTSAFDIDGSGTYTLNDQGESVTFVAFDSTWVTISKTII